MAKWKIICGVEGAVEIDEKKSKSGVVTTAGTTNDETKKNPCLPDIPFGAHQALNASTKFILKLQSRWWDIGVKAIYTMRWRVRIGYGMSLLARMKERGRMERGGRRLPTISCLGYGFEDRGAELAANTGLACRLPSPGSCFRRLEGWKSAVYRRKYSKMC